MTDPSTSQSNSFKWWLLKSIISATLFLVIGVSLIGAIGLAQRIGWIKGTAHTEQLALDGQTYTCPMHPQIRQDEPGRCSICGMELVPAISRGANDLDELAVTISQAARRLAHIKTEEVEQGTVVSTIETVGAIAIDESRMATVPSYIDGRIERLFADYTGVEVAKGDHLAVVYSPELYSAQVEYLEAKKAASVERPSGLAVIRDAQEKLAKSARQRLIELGMTDEQLKELDESGEAQSRLTIYTPAQGTVIEKLAVEGKYVQSGEPIYRIADLSTIWLILELFPEDASRIRFGQRVEAEMQSLPGEVFQGRVAFIDPTVNRDQRTVGVRVEFLNEERRLRPGDYATARIFLPIGQQGEVYDDQLANKWISPMHPQIIVDQPGNCPICGMDLVPTSRYGYSAEPVSQPESLHIPRSAVLMAGSSSVVYVESEPGRFELRPVVVGPILKDRAVILSGLQSGENVATAGNFLIDSQMQLAGKPSVIDPMRAIAKTVERKEPLSLSKTKMIELRGAEGVQIERLFSVYFEIQKILASDGKPQESAAVELHQLASQLGESESIPSSTRSLLSEISSKSEHIHHLSLEEARLTAFRPISHAIIKLSNQIRGQSPSPFQQMFCPMVKGGSGDWLQREGPLRNPYWGAQMLECGELVRQIPVQSESESHQHNRKSDPETEND